MTPNTFSMVDTNSHRVGRMYWHLNSITRTTMDGGLDRMEFISIEKLHLT